MPGPIGISANIEAPGVQFGHPVGHLDLSQALFYRLYEFFFLI